MGESDAASMAGMPEPVRKEAAGSRHEPGEVRQTPAAGKEESSSKMAELLEQVVGRENLKQALKRVRRNKGAAGVDGMAVDELTPYLKTNWLRLRRELLDGVYRPQAVRGVDIPKPGGGVRRLGIPTVVDRFIQQAILQVLTPVFDPTFSESSFGYRPNRSAQQAVAAGRDYVEAGCRWVVDLDVEKFFDRVNHDVLMARVAKRVEDKRLLKLIRRFLEAGMMTGGIVETHDELAAGSRVMASLEKFLSKRLRLRLNRDKSVVGRPWKRTFLGYSMTVQKKPKLKVADESVKRAKGDLRQLFRAGRGRALTRVIGEVNRFIQGWVGYYRLAQTKIVFEEMDEWLRHRCRWLLWRQWKRPRTRAKKMIELGLNKEYAWKYAMNGHGPWRSSGASHMNALVPATWLLAQGLLSVLEQQRRLRLPA